jgi:DNA-binding NtrC family response regulator
LTAGDGKQGLELIASHPEADMVLLDANMPGMNGRQVLDEMERRGLRTPVILSSGYDEGGAATSKEYPNLRAFLPKPYDIQQLAELVAEIIGE